jgi:magnesium-transporting ATPase (P-type)
MLFYAYYDHCGPHCMVCRVSTYIFLQADHHRATYIRTTYPKWINVPTLIVDCVSVAIAFIPEGLPIALTASLTITANLMRQTKILCKSLKTVETLGAVSVICSDKTGTLTKVLIKHPLYFVVLEGL